MRGQIADHELATSTMRPPANTGLVGERRTERTGKEIETVQGQRESGFQWERESKKKEKKERGKY